MEIWKIIRYSGRLWKFYLAIALLVVTVSLLNLVTPFLIKEIVDRLVAHLGGQPAEASFLALLTGAILLSELLIALLSNLNGYLGDVMAQKLNTLLSQRYYAHLLMLPLEYYDNEITGRITGRLERSISSISELMQTLSNNFIQFFLTAFFTIGVIAIYSWPVAIILAVLIPSYIWISHLSSRSWIARQEGINRLKDEGFGRFVEAIGQIRVVKSFTQEKPELAYWQSRRHSIEKAAKVQSLVWHKFDVARRVVLSLFFFVVFGLIVWQTFSRQLTIGEMTLLLQLVRQAQFPLFGASFIIEAMQRAQADTRDFFQVMAIEPAIKDRAGVPALKVAEGRVKYENVSFSYGEGQEVLHQVSFEVEPGSRVALVGESGEGKTTIANLLLRFYETTNGRISIDGQDISTISQASLRRHIGVVFQDPALFSGTVRQNISYGSDKAKEADLVSAAKAANAHGFIVKLPQGYETQIGERGVKLSGGQKQRLAIARALLKNPPLLVLDEATSSLDSKAEREVQAALEKLMSGRTTVIIAHRLSTIQNVDLIVGIKNGRVAELGTPAELAKRDGIYAELLRLQSPTQANRARLRRFEIAAG